MNGQMELEVLTDKMAQLTRLHGFAAAMLSVDPEATWDEIVAEFGEWAMEEELERS